jgi:hypothetical protein
MRTKGKQLTKIVPIVLALALMAVPSSAYALSPYQSGYEHGIGDAKKSVNETWYILQPGKSFAFHTDKFNQGYVDGYCSIAGKGAGSDADQATWECSLDTSAAKNSSRSS